MNKIKVFSSLRAKLGIFAIVLIANPLIAISFTYSRTVKQVIKNKFTEARLQQMTSMAC